MKKGKMFKKFLSILIATLLMLPGVSKVNAAEATYSINPMEALLLEATGSSTNNHTKARAIWTNAGNLYVLIESTHNNESISVTIGGITVETISRVVHPVGENVRVGDTVFVTNTVQGNTKDAHFTVGVFELSALGDSLDGYGITVQSEQGKGHEFGFTIQGGPHVSIEVQKIWLGGPMGDAKINVIRGESIVAETMTLTVDQPSQRVSVPYADQLGRILNYQVEEVDVQEGYVVSYDPVNKTMEGNAHVYIFGVQNEYTPPLMNIDVTKEWKDAGDPQRPEVITFHLYEGDNTEPMLSKEAQAPNWQATFEGVPKTTQEGALISYRVEEQSVEGYESSVDGFVVTNVRVEKMDLEVFKLWQDEPNTADRPETVTFNLLQNGTKIREVTFGEDEGGVWSDEFVDIDKFDDQGDLYEYTITEVTVPGYVGTVEGTTITNTRADTIDIIVMKAWVDLIEGNKPDGITLALYKNGEFFKNATMTPVEDEWSYTFTEQAFDESGDPIAYDVQEVVPDGFKAAIEREGNQFVITNTRSNSRTIRGEKIWLDNGMGRPLSITVNLWQSRTMNEDVMTTQSALLFGTQVVTGDEAGNWDFAFEEIPQYDEDGYPYIYTITEDEVEGYWSEVMNYEDGTFTIINTQFYDLSGEKVWLDDGTGRPESITFRLHRSGGIPEQPGNQEMMDRGIEPFEPLVVTPDENGNWLFSFGKMPAVDEQGAPYLYSVTEDPIEGYVSAFEMNEDGAMILTNTRVGVVDVFGEKIWIDNGVPLRPSSITVNLFQNGTEIDEVEVLPEEGFWGFRFEELPGFDEGGMPYIYTITEDPVPGYVGTVSVGQEGGVNIVNLRILPTPPPTPTPLPEVEEEDPWATVRIVKIDDLDFIVPDVTFDVANEDGVVLFTGTTDEEGVLEVELPLGTYIITETAAPENYIMDEESKTVILDEEDEMMELVVVNIFELEEVEPLPLPEDEEVLYGTLRIVKVDDFDFPVAGVVFDVTDDEGESVFTGTTDEEGLLEISLPLGAYLVTEISAPENYIMDEEPKTITLSEEDELVELVVVNIFEVEEVLPLPLPEDEEEEEQEDPEIEEVKAVLPSTGSTNTMYLYGLGLIMVLGGAKLLSKKREVLK